MNLSKNQSDDIRAIREMMEKSSRFLSLSGLSGLFAGIYAIVGAAIAWFLILDLGFNLSTHYFEGIDESSIQGAKLFLVIDALAVLIAALATAWILSNRKAKKSGQKLWNPVTARMVADLFIPLFAGGLFSLIFYTRGGVQYVAPSMLVFYGIALISASKYTFNEIRFLGLLQILTGLVALIFIGYGFLFWVVGFGLLHIAYGLVIHRKYQ